MACLAVGRYGAMLPALLISCRGKRQLPCAAPTATSAGVMRHFFFKAHVFSWHANQEQAITREEGTSRSHSYPKRRWSLSKAVRGGKYHSTSKPSITGCTVMYDCTVVLCITGIDGNFFI